MPRPTTKQQLLRLSDENYFKVMALIDSLPVEARTQSFPFDDRDRNVRDVVAHVYEWHLLLLRWYSEGMTGKKPAIPAEGYSWERLAELNQSIWQKYQKVSLETVLLKLNASHRELQTMMIVHSDRELFSKNYYSWTGSHSLGSYFISATANHYDWALKKIKRFYKTL